MRRFASACFVLAVLAAAAPSFAQTQPAVGVRASPPPAPQRWPTREGDYVARGFRFADGETLPDLRLHYTTLGAPRRDAAGQVTNAVMVLHGTGGAGAQFLRPQFADVLFAPGGALDIRRWYVILPDGIGHGRSSKPSEAFACAFRTTATPTWCAPSTCS